MTSVAIWFNKEQEVPTIWIVSDSRLSRIGTQPQVETPPLLNTAVKLFSIPIICNECTATGFKICFTTTINFSYAGNSLCALNTQAILTALLSNILVKDTSEIPSLEMIAQYAARVMQECIINLAITYSSSDAPRAICEASINGFCTINQRHEIYHLKPDRSEQFRIVTNCYIVNQVNDNFILLLGDHQDAIKNKITGYRGNLEQKDLNWWRAPQIILQKIIKEFTYPTIGGHLQMGFVTMAGYVSISEGAVNECGLERSYLGFKFSDFVGRLGAGTINMPSLFIPSV